MHHQRLLLDYLFSSCFFRRSSTKVDTENETEKSQLLNEWRSTKNEELPQSGDQKTSKFVPADYLST